MTWAGSGGVVRDTPEMQQALAGITALGRYAVADDIGPVIASLLGDSNHWVTGQHRGLGRHARLIRQAPLR